MEEEEEGEEEGEPVRLPGGLVDFEVSLDSLVKTSKLSERERNDSGLFGSYV